jgi:hypothetical protein
MSIKHSHTIECNQCGDLVSIVGAKDYTDARLMANENGWTSGNHKTDYCPECSTKLNRSFKQWQQERSNGKIH